MRCPFGFGALLVVLGMTVAGCGDAPTQPRLPATPTPVPSPRTPTPGSSPKTPTPTRPQTTPAPTRSEATPTPTVPPFTPTPALDLNGAWTGTISFSADCRKLGATCASPEGVLATLSQTGTTVTARLTVGCEGELELSGALSGLALNADLLRKDGSSIAPLSGTAGQTSVDLLSADLCDPWGYDTTIWLQLSR